MRIGLVVPGFSADPGDWCIPALRHLARALATADDLRVIAVRYPYRAARYALEDADVIAVGGADRRGPAVLTVWRHTLEALRAEHRRRAFDVLHAFWATESGFLTALAGRLLRIPTLISLAGGELVALPAIGYGDQRHTWERFKIGMSLRLATAVSAGSHQLLTIAGRTVPAARLHRAPLGVDLDMFKPDSPRPLRQVAWLKRRTRLEGGPRLRLLHVGTLTRVKDQTTLLRAFSRLRQEVSATLDIVAAGPLHNELEVLTRELGLADAVRFRGSVDHADLPRVYCSGDAFILSSRHEAQGMVAVEAGACGLPVVGTCVGVIPELTSAVAPVGDAEALARAILGVLAAPDQRAHEQARTEFGLDRCVDRFRDVYARMRG
ncbi:MAG: glycosyltransferase [Chloroflexi bacterium]|nr:glycosyltransferase [Chloroflexota bacterium]